MMWKKVRGVYMISSNLKVTGILPRKFEDMDFGSHINPNLIQDMQPSDAIPTTTRVEIANGRNDVNFQDGQQVTSSRPRIQEITAKFKNSSERYAEIMRNAQEWANAVQYDDAETARTLAIIRENLQRLSLSNTVVSRPRRAICNRNKPHFEKSTTRQQRKTASGRRPLLGNV